MMRRHFLNACATVLCAGMAFTTTACSASDDTPDYRYRLSVEVETPEGLRSGSSVLEVKQSMGRSAMDPAGMRISRRLRGEAVSVDLGDGRMLFALLRSETDTDWALSVVQRLSPDTPGESWAEQFDDMLQLEGEIPIPRMWPATRRLPEISAYPMLVTFGDLDDPTSVERVDPDDLAATFGEGVSLSRITVEMTDDYVTTGIDESLGWFRDQAAKGGNLIPMVSNARGRYEVAPGYDEALIQVGVSSFSTEAYEQ